MMPARRRHPRTLFLATLALWGVFFIAVHTMLRDGPWVDELWSLWTIRPPTLAEMFARVSRDFHPPLYFLLLDGWLAVTGDSVVALRLPSAFFGMLGAAGTYALGRRLFDHSTALLAVILLGTSSFFRYYAGETRMYSLLLLVSVLCMMAFLRWLDRPTLLRTTFYALSLASLPYTHYHGVWIVTAQAAYLALVRRDRLVRWLIPAMASALLFLPWLPVMLAQNADRPLLMVRAAAPTNLDTARWIAWFMTGGLGACYLLPALALPNLSRLRERARALTLAALWLILPPVLVLLVNTRAAFFYHPRYLIGILPAGALIAAFGARNASWKLPAYAILAAVIAVEASRYAEFWPSRSAAFGDFFDSLARIAPGDSLILDLDHDNLVDYYDTHYAPSGQPGLRERATLDLTGTQQDIAGVQAIRRNLSDSPRLWLILPSNVPRTWFLFGSLDQTHHATFAGSIMNMLFYRLERGGESDLSYQFGDLATLESALPDGGIIESPAGGPVCLNLSLIALAPLDGRYSLGLHIVGMDGVSRAQWDDGLDVRAAGDEIALAPCVEGASALPPGEYALYVTIYDWSTLIRLPVLEVSTGKQVPWGDTLILSYLVISAG